jgi:rhodanese-related sulfurtransferase
MTKETLKDLLDDPDVIILDVRTGSDWRASESKIKGAVRVEQKELAGLADKYEKNKTLVFYCA